MCSKRPWPPIQATAATHLSATPLCAPASYQTGSERTQDAAGCSGRAEGTGLQRNGVAHRSSRRLLERRVGHEQGGNPFETTPGTDSARGELSKVGTAIQLDRRARLMRMHEPDR